MTVPLQRLRIRYRKTEAAADVQSGQLGRVWAEAFAAAGIELARPEGAKRVRIELGPALPQGATGEREPLDIWLAECVAPSEVCQRIPAHLPPGIEAVEAEEIGDRLPSLGASVRSAAYRVQLPSGAIDRETLQASCADLLAHETLRWVEVRGERVREVDLRSQVLDLGVAAWPDGGVEVSMRLVLGQDQAGRPTSVLAALGVEHEPAALVRTDVEVARPQVAVRAWRTTGRFD